MEKPPIKDKAVLAYVEYLESQLKKYTSSPYCDPYITLKMIVDSGNKKIRALDVDFMADDADKIMTSIEKFATKQKTWAEQLEFFRNKMTPMERKDVDKQMAENAGIAERIALSEKK